MFDPNGRFLCKCSSQSERPIFNLIPGFITVIAAARPSFAPPSKATAGNSEQASLEVVFAKCFKCKMWLWRVSLGQRGGCGPEVKCGSAKYFGLLEPDIHWNSHTMFLHLLELII